MNNSPMLKNLFLIVLIKIERIENANSELI